MPAANWTADNVTEVTILGLWTNGRPCDNVLHIQREEDDAEASARDVLNNWQDDMMSVMMNNYSIVGAHFRDRNSDPGVVGFIGPDPAKPLTGAKADASMPPSVSMLVHKNGTFSVGHRKGRLYVVGIAEVEADEDGVISAGSLAPRQTAVNAFFAGLSGAGGNQLVVVNFDSPTDAVGAKTIVTSMSVDGRVATQRRRLRK